MKNYEAISALAGAGKTYQLTGRFIALLSHDVAPESILAITFTRKAAGEIFDRIIGRLARALLDESERERLEADLRALREESDYQLQVEDLQKWLQRVIRAIPRLRIGTIDSLFMSMTQAFSFDLGLPARLDILEGSVLQAVQEEAFDHAVNAAEQISPSIPWLRDVFRQITRDESKSVRTQLLAIIASAHGLFLENPNVETWGHRENIWTRTPWWASPPTPEEENNLAEAILRDAEQAGNGRYADAWRKALEAFRTGNWRDASGNLFRHLVENWDPDSRRETNFRYYRKDYAITPETMARLRRVTARAFAQYVNRLCAATTGAYHLLAGYERMYAQRVRAAGRLSFRDIEYVLRQAAQSGIKLDIDYRLDGRFDHWMIDEFQDTSRAQWEIMQNLVDELLQSPDRQRTFFYVGDPKQAIYGWRGGDSTLFQHVQTKYRDVFPGRPTILNVCWRSSPVILQAVNRIFDPERLSKCLDASYAREIARWRAHWTHHEAASANAKRPGYVEVRETARPSREGNAADDLPPDKIAMVCDRVKELRNAGVSSIAVLVRLNRYGDVLADSLRAADIPVLREVNPKLCDNGVTSALVSLLFFADHPGNDFFFQHVEHTGLLRAVAAYFEMGKADRHSHSARLQLAARIRHCAEDEGMAGLMARIIRAAFSSDGGWPADEFIGMRMRQLMLAASDFDRLEQGAPSDFAEWLLELEVKDPVVTEGVVVMTVHKAKGLEFDAVILPDLDGRNREMTHIEPQVLWRFEASEDEADNIGTSTDWILQLPHKIPAKLDPVLKCFVGQAKRRRLYEELCLLYVAATRARQALYFIIEKPSDKRAGAADNALSDPFPADLICRTLCAGAIGSTFSMGDPAWFRSKAPSPSETRSEPPTFKPVSAARAESRKRLLAGTPSESEEVAPISAEVLFNPASRRGALRGTIVHALFQQVSWYEPDAVERAIATSRATLPPLDPDLFEEAAAEFRRALETPEIQECLRRPSAAAEVWNEQSFELAEADRWITGRLDRVVVERGADGRIISATVIDFKTDRVVTEPEIRSRVDHYAEQMKWYAVAMSKVTGLRRDDIRIFLLFTHPRKVVRFQ